MGGRRRATPRPRKQETTMPITVIATEGVLSAQAEREVFANLTESFLKLHNLSGNAFMTPNVIGEVSIVPKGKSFSGGKPDDLVIVELKVPSFALSSPQQKQAFIGEATEIIEAATGGKHPRDRIFVNMVYAVDGLWGIGGNAYTNAELGEAVGHQSHAN
jgi:phenylpyruvate tautomerase PptA (4-oxalocrotonate tautomerase family)